VAWFSLLESYLLEQVFDFKAIKYIVFDFLGIMLDINR